jgi:16S rRNA (adenine1518-N6/adenine1519-N6)-dimethyltransferase
LNVDVVVKLITHDWVAGTRTGSVPTTASPGATWNRWDGISPNDWPQGPGNGYDPRTLVVVPLPLLVGWLRQAGAFERLTLMFQQEVADRLCATSGSGEYGRLSILAQWTCEAALLLRVPPTAFVPPPKVASAVVHILPAAEPEGVDPKVLEKLTGAAFGQRRKMLRSSLKAIPGALDTLQTLGIESERRAETVSVEEFVALARALS